MAQPADPQTIDKQLERLLESQRERYLAMPEASVKTFLEGMPLDRDYRLSDYEFKGVELNLPTLELHCTSASCNGSRLFRSISQSPDTSLEDVFSYVTFRCANCGVTKKVFSLSFRVVSLRDSSQSFFLIGRKLGESPAFGPRLPSKVISLIGPDRELFLQGSRCEARGMGVGAFAYYRRVVENQKSRIIKEIAKVAEQSQLSSDIQALFTKASLEGRFRQSVDMIKEVIPPSLFINGNNPLTLLHSALSSGLHDEGMTDDRCLELAQSIRIVLVELAERLATALKTDQELTNALKTLLAHNSQ